MEQVKGQYGALYYQNQRIGGFFYWVKDLKPPIGYCTSSWWVFCDKRTNLEIELYEENNGELKKIQPREKVNLVCSHKIKLNILNKGQIKFEII